jgi:hypothetical protein
MAETTVEHRFDVNDEVVFPDGDELKEGSIDEIVFHLRSHGNKNSIKYRVHPIGRSSATQVLREEQDLIAA